jgi:hypothetical protein
LPIIERYINDGTVNMSSYKIPALYLYDANDYFRAQLIRGELNDTYHVEELTFDITQMLISCRFRDEPCSADDFMEYFDYYYGFCYRFNQGRNYSGHETDIISVDIASEMYGLQLELYAGYAGSQEAYIMNRGFRILVFNKSQVYQSAKDEGIDVSTGVATNIAVERVFSYTLKRAVV